jgi:hypothetical protein
MRSDGFHDASASGFRRVTRPIIPEGEQKAQPLGGGGPPLHGSGRGGGPGEASSPRWRGPVANRGNTASGWVVWSYDAAGASSPVRHPHRGVANDLPGPSPEQVPPRREGQQQRADEAVCWTPPRATRLSSRREGLRRPPWRSQNAPGCWSMSAIPVSPSSREPPVSHRQPSSRASGWAPGGREASPLLGSATPWRCLRRPSSATRASRPRNPGLSCRPSRSPGWPRSTRPLPPSGRVAD